MTDRLIDFGDDSKWHDSLHTHQLELDLDPEPSRSQPTTIPPPYTPRGRLAKDIEDVDTKGRT